MVGIGQPIRFVEVTTTKNRQLQQSNLLNIKKDSGNENRKIFCAFLKI